MAKSKYIWHQGWCGSGQAVVAGMLEPSAGVLKQFRAFVAALKLEFSAEIQRCSLQSDTRFHTQIFAFSTANARNTFQ